MPRSIEVLSSASLLLTTITVMLGLWYSEIQDARSVRIPDHPEDASKELRQVETALRHRLAPLLMGALFVACAFLPIVGRELWSSWANMRANGIAAFGDYDPATVALTAVVALLLIIAWTLLLMGRDLIDIRGKLRP
jgi:predicted small integral membrane protein